VHDDEDGDLIALPSGRKIRANNRIIGIDDKCAVFEGYDGGVDSQERPASRFRIANDPA
jgi:hypothetical protein